MCRAGVLAAALVVPVALVAWLLSGLLFGGVGRPIRWELPDGYTGWVTVQYTQPACEPIGHEGLWLVIRVPASGQACVSDPMPSPAWRFQRFDYLSSDGRLTPISTGTTDGRIWARSVRPNASGEVFFVGT